MLETISSEFCINSCTLVLSLQLYLSHLSSKHFKYLWISSIHLVCFVCLTDLVRQAAPKYSKFQITIFIHFCHINVKRVLGISSRSLYNILMLHICLENLLAKFGQEKLEYLKLRWWQDALYSRNGNGNNNPLATCMFRNRLKFVRTITTTMFAIPRLFVLSKNVLINNRAKYEYFFRKAQKSIYDCANT